MWFEKPSLQNFKYLGMTIINQALNLINQKPNYIQEITHKKILH
jgi:hypothetical protein